MSYTPFYPGGWQSGQSGGTPICPEALNHIEEGIANAAPSGYGLGGAETIAFTDIDTKTSPGWYRMSDITIDGQSYNYAYMGVDAYSAVHGLQKLHIVHNPVYSLQRQRHSNIWQPWEWDNPPMLPGVEYRTTRRHQGRPVYRKLIIYTNVDTVGSGSGVVSVNIPHGITGMTSMVGCGATTDGYQLPYISLGGGITSVVGATKENIILRMANTTWPPREWQLDISYTK